MDWRSCGPRCWPKQAALVYVWPALILVLMLVKSSAGSTVLLEFGWLLLLICSVKAAQGMSWRSALARSPRAERDEAG